MLQLITLLSFLLPTQLGYFFHFLDINLMGFSIDYLIPALYLTDILAVLIIVLGLNKVKLNTKFFVFGLFYFIFATFNILNSEVWLPSFYKWIKLTEFILLTLVIVKTKEFNFFLHFVKPLSFSMLIVNILGLLQFINKGSIQGLFYFLGERYFIFESPNVSPYPYSTFSHPNSYAGFLLIFTIYLINYRNRFNIKFFYVSLILSVVGIFLTNSLNVYLAIFCLLIIYLFTKSKEKLFLNGFVMLPFLELNQRYITHRVELIKVSLSMIKENFLSGVGLNNFIPTLSRISTSYVNAWELQPVHNIFLLVFSELGVIGFVLFLVLFFAKFSIFNFPLLVVLITGLSDHYWLTLQQNSLLLVFVLIKTYREIKAYKN